VWHSSAQQKRQEKSPTNAANRIFTPIKKQPISLFFALVVGVLSCYEIYFDAPDMNCACERNTVLLFSKTRSGTFAVFMIL